MATANTCILMGRLGRDPELRTTTTGKQVCKFSIATDSGYGERRTTHWHNIVVWGNSAGACATHLRKGKSVLVEGEITYKQYESQGSTRYVTEIVARQVTFVDRGEAPSSSQTHDHAPASSAWYRADLPDGDPDVPF